MYMNRHLKIPQVHVDLSSVPSFDLLLSQDTNTHTHTHAHTHMHARTHTHTHTHTGGPAPSHREEGSGVMPRQHLFSCSCLCSSNQIATCHSIAISMHLDCYGVAVITATQIGWLFMCMCAVLTTTNTIGANDIHDVLHNF